MSETENRLTKAADKLEADAEQVANSVAELKQVNADLQTEVTRLTELVNNQGGDTTNLNALAERLEGIDAKLDEVTGVTNPTE